MPDAAELRRIDFLPTQARFIQVEHPDVDMDVAVYQGGWGSGKTFSGCNLGIFLCKMNPGIRGFCIGKTSVLLRETTIATYDELLQLYGYVEGRDFTFLRSHGKEKIIFHCYGNSKIIFRHIETPDAIRSINAGFIQVEECSQITEMDFLELLGRLRQAGIKRYRFFGHTNPQPSKGWIHKYFVERNHNDGRPMRITLDDGREVVIQYRRIIAPSTENKNLPAHYIHTLSEQLDPELYRMFVLGEDGDYTAGLVVKNWTIANEDNGLIYDPSQVLEIFCDFNKDPMCWGFGHRDRKTNMFYQFGELARRYTYTEEAADMVCRQFKDHRSGIIITGDASGQYDRSEGSKKTGRNNYEIMCNVFYDWHMKNFSLDLAGKNGPIADRIAAFNAAVCNNLGQRHYKLNPDTCPRTLWNMGNARYIPGTSEIWKPSTKEMERDGNMVFMGHPLDAVSYWVNRYAPIPSERTNAINRANRARLVVR